MSCKPDPCMILKILISLFVWVCPFGQERRNNCFPVAWKVQPFPAPDVLKSLGQVCLSKVGIYIKHRMDQWRPRWDAKGLDTVDRGSPFDQVIKHPHHSLRKGFRINPWRIAEIAVFFESLRIYSGVYLFEFVFFGKWRQQSIQRLNQHWANGLCRAELLRPFVALLTITILVSDSSLHFRTRHPFPPNVQSLDCSRVWISILALRAGPPVATHPPAHFAHLGNSRGQRYCNVWLF